MKKRKLKMKKTKNTFIKTYNLLRLIQLLKSEQLSVASLTLKKFQFLKNLKKFQLMIFRSRKAVELVGQEFGQGQVGI